MKTSTSLLLIVSTLCFYALSTIAQETPAEQPAQPKVSADQALITEPAKEAPSIPSAVTNPSILLWTLIALVGLLSLGTFGLSIYCYRLTQLRLRHANTISFGDSVAEWMQQLEAHWNNSHTLHANHASSTIDKLQDVSAALDAQSKGHFEKLANAFKQHHQIIGGELKEMSADLAQTREILATVQRVAEDKKQELEDYKAGFRVSISKDALGHLCDVRDNLNKIRSIAEKSPSGSEKILAALEDIDWELSDTLDNCDLIELKVEPGTSIRDESLSGKHKVLGKQPAPSPKYHGRVAEVIKHGYLIRVPRKEGEETQLFRPVQITVYADQNASNGEDQAPQPL